ncbi:2-hydroxychromene-2-carboxylate isomerase [Neptuniibacter sp.]|uniref:2-hydroxychromene-2-carboxylate isomerase n=1 Tax=Neptuniibacter sp. TaxID=1962643 RepID=UPI003B596B09
MNRPIDVTLYFNFRSPYCYLASKTLWPVVDDYDVNLIWKPVGGWNLRSSPDRAKKKVPLARQDVARFARRLQIPLNPPPMETETTLAAKLSLLAEEKGVLREYIISVMDKEWAEGQNIGEQEILFSAGERAGLNRDDMQTALDNPEYMTLLEANVEEADEKGVIGVPTFLIGDQIFWGQDRIEFVLEELDRLTAEQDGG